MPGEDELSQESRAKKARELTLYARWLKGGRLSVPELREVRALIGEENYAKALELLGVGKDEPAAPAPTDKYQFDYATYARRFGRSVRQVKRWVAEGRAADPPELPPFDHPELMRDWWGRHKDQRCPPAIEQAALDATRAPAAGNPGPPASASIDVSQLTLLEGEAIRQARGFLVAASTALQAAYLAGRDAEIERLTKRWNTALNTLSLAEGRERAAKKQAGEVIPKAVLFPELSSFLEVLRVMRSTMARRIRSNLGVLPDGLGERIEKEIEIQRGGEESVMRRLGQFQKIEDVELELTAD